MRCAGADQHAAADQLDDHEEDLEDGDAQAVPVDLVVQQPLACGNTC